MNYYNGYSPKQRNKKLAALHRLYPNYSHPYYKPPCHLCGDATAEVQPHSEDYAEPFLWERPAVLCRVFSLPLAASRSLRLAGIVARLQGTFTARRLRFRPAHSEDRSRGLTAPPGGARAVAGFLAHDC